MSPLTRQYRVDATESHPPPAADGALRALDEPERYLPDPGLEDAVNVALFLQRPLLLTGEPGSGKTALAWSVARRLGLDEPLVFNTKTTSTAKDLFYRYDGLRHFQDVQLQRARPAEAYVEYEALGRAIMMASEPTPGEPPLPEGVARKPQRSVVLIDEVDKAPRDLPNDVLREIERMEFDVVELERRRTFRAAPGRKPIVILTSNSEKNLPDAFLRRCVFYHVPFPDAERLKTIVRWRLGLRDEPNAAERGLVRFALREFDRIRESVTNKRPATAELLDWLRVLKELDLRFSDDGRLLPAEGNGGGPRDGARRDSLALTYTVLAKNREDMARLKELGLDRGGAAPGA